MHVVVTYYNIYIIYIYYLLYIMVMVMVMEILFHLGRPLAMRLLYKAPRTAQIQVTVGHAHLL